MKSLYLRVGAAVACAASLIACGGGNNGTLRLSGSVAGLSKSGLVITDGKVELPILANAGGFVFAEPIGSDTNYNVTIKTQPTGAVCALINGNGNSGRNSVTTIHLNCVTNAYKLAGSVSALSSGELVLVNGSDRVTIPANATTFEFAHKVADDAPFVVTVLTQPSGQTCTVRNGVGRMGTADFTLVQVDC